jgi:hypothetical protein
MHSGPDVGPVTSLRIWFSDLEPYTSCHRCLLSSGGRMLHSIDYFYESRFRMIKSIAL